MTSLADLALANAAHDLVVQERRIAALGADVEIHRALAVEAIHQLHELTRQVTSLREQNGALRAELRRYTSAAVSGRAA